MPDNHEDAHRLARALQRSMMLLYAAPQFVGNDWTGSIFGSAWSLLPGNTRSESVHPLLRFSCSADTTFDFGDTLAVELSEQPEIPYPDDGIGRWCSMGFEVTVQKVEVTA
jgi:hypothetical protein